MSDSRIDRLATTRKSVTSFVVDRFPELNGNVAQFNAETDVWRKRLQLRLSDLAPEQTLSSVSSSSTVTASGALPLSGGVMTGPLLLNGDGRSPLSPVTLQQLEAAVTSVGGAIQEITQVINSITNPTSSTTIRIPVSAVSFTGAVAGVFPFFSFPNADFEVTDSSILIDESGVISIGETTLFVDSSNSVIDAYAEVRFWDDAGSKYFGVKAGSGMATSVTRQWPTSAGSSGDALVLDSGGNFTFTPLTTGSVTSVTGTANKIDVLGTTAVVVTISSTYIGQGSITTVGTIGSGTWQGSAVTYAFGGTGLTAVAVGDIIYGSSTSAWSRLAAGSNTQVLTLASGIPSWATPTTGTVTKSGSPASTHLAVFTGASDITGTSGLTYGSSVLGVTGAITASTSITSGKYVRASGTDTPSSGGGLELQWDGLNGYLVSTTRGPTAAAPLIVSAASLDLAEAVTFSTLTASRMLYLDGSKVISGVTDGSANYVLKTNGTGTYAFASLASLGSAVTSGWGNYKAITSDGSGNLAATTLSASHMVVTDINGVLATPVNAVSCASMSAGAPSGDPLSGSGVASNYGGLFPSWNDFLILSAKVDEVIVGLKNFPILS